MKTAIALLVAAVVLSPLPASAIDVSGDQWGTWIRENSPYNVVGHVRVPPESTLVIEPGVVVDFLGYYKFRVDSLATLLSVGTEDDSIVFTCDTLANPSRWQGIRFYKAASACSLKYCCIEHGDVTGNYPDHRGGGIFCHSSDISISYNFIAMNSADSGAGIYADSSACTISHNTIVGNYSVTQGGGIYTRYCDDAIISNNTISGNRALRGGGMACIRDENITVSDNIVSGNYSFASGPSIRFQRSSGLITRNLVYGNWCEAFYAGNGGGIYTRKCGSDLIVSENIVTGNNAAGRGGGIFCREANTIIINNTVTGNRASLGGGFAARQYGHPLLINNIFWADTSENGQEICLRNQNFDPCTLTVLYCDVEGGESGVQIQPDCILNWSSGNLDSDPIFSGPGAKDFHLRWHSPCIDAGDFSRTDPDGTRSDIGALYFDQDVEGIVELYPPETPIVIPPEGGEFTYDRWVFNPCDDTLIVDLWSYLYVPGDGRSDPFDQHSDRFIPPHDSLGENNISGYVSGLKPAGDYTLVCYIGDYPSGIIDSSYFYFSKEVSPPPRNYALSQNYPNPFNATTMVNYQLPVDGYVKLEVYNVLGQKVATLVDSRQQTGYRSVTWDASNISSGLYFYKLTAGDFTETRRMMLVK